MRRFWLAIAVVATLIVASGFAQEEDTITFDGLDAIDYSNVTLTLDNGGHAVWSDASNTITTVASVRAMLPAVTMKPAECPELPCPYCEHEFNWCEEKHFVSMVTTKGKWRTCQYTIQEALMKDTEGEWFDPPEDDE